MNWKRMLATLASVISLNAHAGLDIGASAPDFSAPATLGGNTFTFVLHDALKQGPVVLYFYPAAFTPGCTIEAHAFAEATDQFHALGAQVIGVSHDPLEKLQRFSVSECRSKFAVAADTDGSIMKSYRAVLIPFSSYASRTSYAIAPNGTIMAVYTSLDPAQHVTKMLDALRQWKARQPDAH